MARRAGLAEPRLNVKDVDCYFNSVLSVDDNGEIKLCNKYEN